MKATSFCKLSLVGEDSLRLGLGGSGEEFCAVVLGSGTVFDNKQRVTRLRSGDRRER